MVAQACPKVLAHRPLGVSCTLAAAHRLPSVAT